MRSGPPSVRSGSAGPDQLAPGDSGRRSCDRGRARMAALVTGEVMVESSPCTGAVTGVEISLRDATAEWPS